MIQYLNDKGSSQFLLNCIQPIRNHFIKLDERICVFVSFSLILFTLGYCFIPHSNAYLQTFLAEHIELYSIVDSFPQRMAYNLFLVTITLLAILSARLSKNLPHNQYVPSKHWPILIFTFLLMAAVTNLFILNLDTRAFKIFLIIFVAAYTASYAKWRWIAWSMLAALILLATLPGWLHTPAPMTSILKDIDQHYNTVIYRGRQLAAGYLFSQDNPPYYSLLWSTLLGIFSKEFQVPTFAMLVRFVQLGQLLCLLAFVLAGWIRIRCFNDRTRTLALIFLTLGVIPWLSTDSFAIWFPNQSGLRFLMMPVALCFSAVIERVSKIQAGMMVGGISGLALIANFETGIAVTAAMGITWLLQLRHQPRRLWLYSVIAGIAGFFSIFLVYSLMYFYFFKAWPLGSIFTFFLTYVAGFGGLELPFRPIVLVMMAHAGYIFIQSIQGVLNPQAKVSDPMTCAIATMILVWFPYYFNRPDDWDLWVLIALYCLLIIPIFVESRQKNLVLFILASVIILPIAVRSLPVFVLSPLKDIHWETRLKAGCGDGLILPQDYCAHLEDRAKTLKDFSTRGSVAWLSVLPVMTNQATPISNPLWTGNLLEITLTNQEFAKLVQKIKNTKVQYLLFDDPKDPFIQPRSPESSFNHKLIAALGADYCRPYLSGGWLIAQRQSQGHC